MLGLTHIWYRHSLWHPVTLLLLPISWMFAGIIALRHWCYRRGLLKQHRFNVPVIVVGNITVGGTGKTPLVIWLAQYLKSKGLNPGIISRGCGGHKHVTPYWVNKDDLPAQVGDESLLTVRNTDCPLVICKNKVAAISALLDKTACDVIISDDGLQHYRLVRDIEIAVIDGLRRLGNRCLLPAGPLREFPTRLQNTDYVIVNGVNENGEFCDMLIQPKTLVSLKNPAVVAPLSQFKGLTVHAVAGIGHPERFFANLRQLGFKLIPHVFPDHYLYKARDLCFNDSLPIIMTEKDAIKCYDFANENCWYLQIEVKINDQFRDDLSAKIFRLLKSSPRMINDIRQEIKPC